MIFVLSFFTKELFNNYFLVQNEGLNPLKRRDKPKTKKYANNLEVENYYAN
jgi:hypothetical protein